MAKAGDREGGTIIFNDGDGKQRRFEQETRSKNAGNKVWGFGQTQEVRGKKMRRPALRIYVPVVLNHTALKAWKRRADGRVKSNLPRNGRRNL